MTRPGHAERRGVEVIPPTRHRSFPRLSVAGCARGRRQKATAPLERRSLAVSPPLHRNHRPPLLPHPAGEAVSPWIGRWGAAKSRILGISKLTVFVRRSTSACPIRSS